MSDFCYPVVLDGGLAVPCNPKPADAGSKGVLSSVWCRLHPGSVTVMKVGSGDGRYREPRQDRKVATVNGAVLSHREAWLEPIPPGPLHQLSEDPGTAGTDRMQLVITDSLP